MQASEVSVLGLACKRNIADLREPPPLTIIELLGDQGAKDICNAPYFHTFGRARRYGLNMTNTPLDGPDATMPSRSSPATSATTFVLSSNKPGWSSIPAMRPRVFARRRSFAAAPPRPHSITKPLSIGSL